MSRKRRARPGPSAAQRRPDEPVPSPSQPTGATPGTSSAVAAKPRARLSLRKKLLFSLLTVGAALAALELVLAVCGVRPVLYDEDPYVGFSAHVPLFVERTADDGTPVMATADIKRPYFNPQQFPQHKPAGAFRVFCLGGSTAYGHPYDDRTSFCGWLRVLLPAADASRRWELINCGGISYASYREALLMEELIRYQPDLFIIYSGQNEFLERRTYRGIIETPPVVRGLGALAGRTRTYTAARWLADALRRPAAEGATSRDVLPGEVETELERSVGPTSYTRDDELRGQVLAHFRYNLARMATIAASVGARVIYVTPASNLRDCAPFKSEHRAGLAAAEVRRWQRLADDAQQARRDGRFAEALSLADRAAAIDDRHAGLHYLRGRVLDGLKRPQEARAAYQRARDEDVCPLRALGPMHDIVAEVAGERGATVVDFAALVEQLSPDGIPGDNLFLDHVHPTIEGNRRLALALLDAMRSAGIVHPGSDWNEVATERIARRVESDLDRRAHAAALRNVAKVLEWAGKFEDAERVAKRAIGLDPTDAEAYFVLGTCAKSLGRPDEAVRHYEKSLELTPGAAIAHSNLGAVLDGLGRSEPALVHFQSAIKLGLSPRELVKARVLAGGALMKLGRLDDAVEQLQEALRLEANNADAHDKLGIALFRLNRREQALEQFREAAKLAPHDAAVQNNLANALLAAGQTAEAIEHLRAALQADPAHALARVNLADALRKQAPQGLHDVDLADLRRLAWSLATNVDSRLRDGRRAIGCAELAAKAEQAPSADTLDTLAAAYAEAGRFAEAVAAAQQAAAAAGSSALGRHVAARLALYRQRQPYHAPPPE